MHWSGRSIWRGPLGTAAALTALAAPIPATADPIVDPSEPTPVTSTTPTPTTPTPAPPTPGPPTPAPTTTPRAELTPSGHPSASRSPAPSASAAFSSTRAPAVRAVAVAGPPTLTVTAAGSPVAGHFFEDVGAYAMAGSASGVATGTTVAIYRRTVSQLTWGLFAVTTTDAGGRYAASVPVRDVNTYLFIATVGGAPDQTGILASGRLTVQVADSSVVMNPVVRSIDSLRDPRI